MVCCVLFCFAVLCFVVLLNCVKLWNWLSRVVLCAPFRYVLFCFVLLYCGLLCFIVRCVVLYFFFCYYLFCYVVFGCAGLSFVVFSVFFCVFCLLEKGNTMKVHVISNKAWPYSVPKLFGQPNYGPLMDYSASSLA